MKPASNGKDTVIRYGVGPTCLGQVLVGLSERGVCVLKILGNDDMRTALDDIRDRFPASELVEAPHVAAPVVRQVNEVLSGERAASDVPLDLRGTPFYQRVWRVMQQIPRGTTCSYSELAKRAGRPRAVRAAASACARNPIAVLVPCHRILRRDGSLGGYGGGVECKRELLRLEQEGSLR